MNWSNIKKHIPWIKVESNFQEQQKLQKKYEEGLAAGRKDGMNFMMRHTRDLTEDEFEEFIKFLKDRNMILTYRASSRIDSGYYNEGIAVRIDITKDTRPYRREPLTGITYLTD